MFAVGDVNGLNDSPPSVPLFCSHQMYLTPSQSIGYFRQYLSVVPAVYQLYISVVPAKKALKPKPTVYATGMSMIQQS